MHNIIYKLTTLFFITTVLTLSASAKSTSSIDNKIMDSFELTKVAKHTWVILGPFGLPSLENKGFINNPAFIVTDKSVVVIDPGSSANIGRSLLKKIRSKTNKPITHVFNTHVHGDHWLGNDAIQESYPNVKIFSHPVMIKEAKAGEAELWINRMNNLTQNATKGTRIIYPTNALTNGQEVKIDNITIKAYLSEQAHTKTDAMFQIIEDKVLITGDNIFNTRMPRLDDGSFTGNIDAMTLGLSLDIETVIPGHGPIGGKKLLQTFHELLSVIYNTSKELMEDDMESFEMKDTIVNKLKKYQSWDNFDNTIGRLISLAVLEAENE